MKKKTYRILKMLPFGKVVLHLTGNGKFIFCSPGIAEGIYQPIFEYAKEHSDEVITQKLGDEILRKNVEVVLRGESERAALKKRGIL